MSIKQKSSRRLSKISLLLILVSLSACNLRGANSQPVASSTAERPVLPTPSSTPEIEQVYFVADDGTSDVVKGRLEESIAALSTAAGYEFVVSSDFSKRDVENNAKIVFFLSADPALVDLAALNPAVQFVAIGVQDLSEASNVSRIGPEGFRADQVGFMAGVLAASITPNWRVGAVSLLNDGEETASNTGFQNGVIFHCGLCRPAYPPFNAYPVGVETSSTDLSTMQNSVSSLVALDVDTVFLSPALSEAASIDLISASSITYIGGESPGDDLGELWVASVRAAPEIAIEEMWDRLSRGEGGETVPMPIIIEDINPERLTPGRETWALEILQDLVGGYIDTGVDPNTGIAR